jgi:ribonuclease P protein component
VKNRRNNEACTPPLTLSIETLGGFGSFTRVITHGKKYEKEPIKAFVYSSISQQRDFRVGFTVTREIRKATQRNLIKRLMREAFRTRREEFFTHFNSGILLEIVFLYHGDAKIPPKKIKFASIDKAMAELSSKMSIGYSK